VSSDEFSILLTGSFIASAASAAVWGFRPELRKSNAFRIVLGASVTVLLLLVGFFALLLYTFSNLELRDL
jgi:hypothetical protein